MTRTASLLKGVLVFGALLIPMATAPERASAQISGSTPPRGLPSTQAEGPWTCNWHCFTELYPDGSVRLYACYEAFEQGAEQYSGCSANGIQYGGQWCRMRNCSEGPDDTFVLAPDGRSVGTGSSCSSQPLPKSRAANVRRVSDNRGELRVALGSIADRGQPAELPALTAFW